MNEVQEAEQIRILKSPQLALETRTKFEILFRFICDDVCQRASLACKLCYQLDL